jgi:hypothetical protein
MGLALKDKEQYCYSDNLHWPDNNYELIDGEAYFMAPASNLEYQEVAGEIFRKIANALAAKKCRALIASVDGVQIEWGNLLTRLPVAGA